MGAPNQESSGPAEELGLRNEPVKARRWKWMIIGFLLAAAGGSVCYLVFTHNQPKHEGKALEYWVDQVPFTIPHVDTNGDVTAVPGSRLSVQFDRQYTGENSATALLGVRAIGEPALPFLLRKLQTEDTAARTNLQKWAAKLGYKGRLYEPALLARGEAITALIALKPLPEGVSNQLRELSLSAKPEIAEPAKLVLGLEWRDLAGSSQYYPQLDAPKARGRGNPK